MRSSYAEALDAPTPRGGTVVMQGNHIDCGRRITDSLTGRNATTLNHAQNLPRGHKLIAGGQTTISI